MAFGNYGNNNNNNGSNNGNNKVYDNTYYAKTYFNNYDENKSLDISYSAGLMTITINQKTSDGKKEEIIKASLTGLKAGILASAIESMEKDIETGSAEGRTYGVQSGMGDVVKVIGTTVNNGSKQIIIAKVDKSGNVSEKTFFTFPLGVDYFMSWSNFDNMDFTKSYEDNMQFSMFKNILTDFSRNISGAAGYGTLYLNKYEQNRDRGRMVAVMEKLGVSVKSAVNRSRDNFFNNNDGGGNRYSEHKTSADLDAMLGDDED